MQENSRFSNCSAGRAGKPRVQLARAARLCPRCAQPCPALGAHLYCMLVPTPPAAPPGWASVDSAGRTRDASLRPSAAPSSGSAGLQPLSVAHKSPATCRGRSQRQDRPAAKSSARTAPAQRQNRPETWPGFWAKLPRKRPAKATGWQRKGTASQTSKGAQQEDTNSAPVRSPRAGPSQLPAAAGQPLAAEPLRCHIGAGEHQPATSALRPNHALPRPCRDPASRIQQPHQPRAPSAGGSTIDE